MIVLNVQCISCHRDYELVVPKDGYQRWINGELIQKALPNVHPAIREMLISGICPDCFKKKIK